MTDTVDYLMSEIVRLDIKPQVFTVSLQRTDHSSGATAYVSFRDNYANPQGMSSFTVHGDSSVTILQNLRDTLIRTLGPCEHCGRYEEGE